MTKGERSTRLKSAGYSFHGLGCEPCHSAYLDLFDQLDQEGCGKLADAFASEVKRSGTPSGFELEAMLAKALIKVPPCRTIDYELQAGNATRPGDLGLKKCGVRYEFQCKAMLNWRVEKFVADAIDTAVANFPPKAPSCSFELRYSNGTKQKDWTGFPHWLLEQLATDPRPGRAMYVVSGKDVCEVALRNAPGGKDCGRLSTIYTMGGGEMVDVGRLRDKIDERASKAKNTFSTKPSDSHRNILAVEGAGVVSTDVDTWAQAIYGTLACKWSGDPDDTTPPRPTMLRDGVFQPSRLEWLSAIALVHRPTYPNDADGDGGHDRASSGFKNDPLFRWVTVFPRPELLRHFAAATSDWPDFRVFVGWDGWKPVFALKS